MKNRRVRVLLYFAIILSIVCYGCGNKSDSFKKSTDVAENYDREEKSEEMPAELNSSSYNKGEESDYVDTESLVDAISGGEDSGITNTSAASTVTNETVSNSHKLIKTVSMDVETLEYDKLIGFLNNQIAELGGYVESSESTGNQYYDTTSSRYSSMVVRIPVDHLDQFVNVINKESNVTRKEETTKDVTLDYVDTKSRNQSLKVEEERILELVKKAETLEDIVTLESRLSDLRYEIESGESRLRTYDNLVEYSTVNISISEVEHITKVVEKKESVWRRIEVGYSNNLEKFKNFVQNFTVWFVVNLPVIIFLCFVSYIVLIIYKKHVKLKNNKKDLHE